LTWLESSSSSSGIRCRRRRFRVEVALSSTKVSGPDSLRVLVLTGDATTEGLRCAFELNRVLLRSGYRAKESGGEGGAVEDALVIGELISVDSRLRFRVCSFSRFS